MSEEFVRDVPEVAISDGLMYFQHLNGEYKAVMLLSGARALHRRMAAAFAAHETRQDNVIPLCELCISRNLPRD